MKYVPVLGTIDCVENPADELFVFNSPKCLPVVVDSGVLAESQEKRSVS